MLQRLIVSVLSAGWIVPLYASAFLLLRHVELLGAGALAQNSFPYLRASSQLLALGSLWLAVVVVAWAWRLSK